MSPFVRDPSTAAANVDQGDEMVDFMRREKVDVVVACDLDRTEMVGGKFPPPGYFCRAPGERWH